MPRAPHPEATVGQDDGAETASWRYLVGQAIRQFLRELAGDRPRRKKTRRQMASEAARTLSEIGREERNAYERFHDRLRQERAAGWPSPKLRA